MIDAGLLGYNFRLAVSNIRRNPILSALMVAAIGVGIGASMAMVTVNYRFGADPIPQKSSMLYKVRLDSWSPERTSDDAPVQLTYLDAAALLAEKRAYREAMMSGAQVSVEPPDRDQRAFFADVRAATTDFFELFDAPFRYGAGWTSDIDEAAEQVVVLSAQINERLFGGADSVGETLTLSGRVYRVIGVLDDWAMSLRVWDVGAGSGPGSEIEDLFVPWNLVVANELQRQGNINCWQPIQGEGVGAFLNSECVWIQYWAELRDPEEHAAYVDFLDTYVLSQKELGRFPRELNNAAQPLVEWLDEAGSAPSEVLVLLGLSVIFLAVCLINTIGLLLAKFLGKANEIGIRRALGASRRALMQQYLLEAGVIGAAGGALGLALTWLALKGIDGQLEDDLSSFLSMDWNMAFAAMGLAIVATLITSIYPTWRACNVQPAAHLSAN